jgi:2-oxoglutarate ferredoxin oxidoreductase subunit alpha
MGRRGGYDRGKVMSAEELEAGRDFGRYKDVDGDGIPWRTLPGHAPHQGLYFTRGTTRDPYARYSERGPDYVYNMERLLRKFETAATLVPQPVLRAAGARRRAGRHLLRLDQPGHAGGAGGAGRRRASTSTRCACAPSRSRTERGEFIAAHERVFVVEQNRDAQMRTCWSTSWRSTPARLVKVLHYDGTPITARFITGAITAHVQGAAAQARANVA